MATYAQERIDTGSLAPQGSVIGTSSPEEWVDSHGNHLLRYAHSRVRNTHVAEELVQETFIAALKGRKRFSGRSSERTWFIGILRHKIIDYFRKSSRERATADLEELPDLAEGGFEARGDFAQAPTSWGNDPLKAAESADFWNILRSCIDTLPENLAEAFVLREIEGLTSEEVCKTLEITPNNLWVRLHRARTQLRKGLEVKWYGGQRSLA